MAGAQTQEIHISILFHFCASTKYIVLESYTDGCPDDNVGSFSSGSNVNWKGVLLIREVSKDL